MAEHYGPLELTVFKRVPEQGPRYEHEVRTAGRRPYLSIGVLKGRENTILCRPYAVKSHDCDPHTWAWPSNWRPSPVASFWDALEYLAFQEDPSRPRFGSPLDLPRRFPGIGFGDLARERGWNSAVRKQVQARRCHGFTILAAPYFVFFSEDMELWVFNELDGEPPRRVSDPLVFWDAYNSHVIGGQPGSEFDFSAFV